MQTNTPKSGYDVEDQVEEICKIIYLSDFVVRSPKYIKQSGKAKEAADFLVPFDDTLLTFQVKSKNEIKSAIEKSEIDFKRINARIDEGVTQLNTIKRAIKANHLLELTNIAGIKIPFSKDSFKEIIGIVIIDLLGEEKFSQSEQTEILNGFLVKYDIPIHIFLRDHFQKLSTEIDTLPDFIDYIKKRQVLYERRTLSPFTSELDLLSTYKTNPQLIDDCLNGKCDLLVITDGLWDSYKQKHRIEINKRNIANNPSYIIDYIITDLRNSIDYKLDVKSIFENNDVKQGTIEEYWSLVTELSKLPRLIRRELGNVFIKKMEKAKKTGTGHSLIQYDDNSIFVILSTKIDRQNRVKGLYNLTSAAYCGLNAKKAIGIATEAFGSKERSFDVIILENVKFQNEDELHKSFERNFGKPSHIKLKEYD